MKSVSMFLIVLVATTGLSVQGHATLYDRGADSLGYHLIYDSDRNITWYDYSSAGGWTGVRDWAEDLTVYFGANTYSDWRLPTALNQDGSGPCSNYNCTASEMGHLFYTELKNIGERNTPLGDVNEGWGLNNTGPLSNLQPAYYFSGTEYYNPYNGYWQAWFFHLNQGYQGTLDQGTAITALAVRDGDVSAVPEPASLLLLGLGLVGLAGFRKRK